MSNPRALTIRQFNRLELNLPLTLCVADGHVQQVLFSRSSGARDGEIHGTAVDLSSGGLGALTKWYLPRMCEGVVRVFAPSDGSDVNAARLLLEQRVKVRRVSQTSEQEGYALGLAFLAPDENLNEQIAAIEQYIEPTGAANGTFAPTTESEDV